MMFTIADPFANQIAFSSHSNLLLSQNLQVRRATDLLDQTLHSKWLRKNIYTFYEKILSGK